MTDRRVPIAICAGVRTPFARAFGRYLGATADDLARAVIAETIARSGIDPGRLDEVIVGCAGPPVEAMNVARVAALRAGVPDSVPATTVHRNCGSGLEAAATALERVRAGDGGLFVAAGAESMTEAPFQMGRRGQRGLLRMNRARGIGAKLAVALKLRPSELLAHNTLRPALTDPVSGLSMGETAEVLAREFSISRAEQDAFAAESQRRAAAARERGVFREESMSFAVPPALSALVVEDDGIRPEVTVESLARLRPVFDRRFGTVTVGNACQLTDGAAALLLASEDRARELGLPILGRIRDAVSVGVDPRRMGLGPAVAIPRLLARNGLAHSDVDLVEINEAFAVQVLACLKVLGATAPDRARLNPNGGAIALGHPVGASGVRLIWTLLLELRRRGARTGIASLCVGGGQGVAALVEAESP